MEKIAFINEASQHEIISREKEKMKPKECKSVTTLQRLMDSNDQLHILATREQTSEPDDEFPPFQ